MKIQGNAWYCKKCFKALNPPKQRQKKGMGIPTKTTDTRTPDVPLEITPSIIESMVKSLSSVFTQPIRIELAPLQLQVTNTGPGVQIAAPDTLPIQQPARPVQHPQESLPSASSPPMTAMPLATTGRTFLEPTLLQVMGTRKHKWRPLELVAELNAIHPDLKVTEDDVVRALERLCMPSAGTSPAQQVIQMSTRYMRRDFLVEADEIDFIDLFIMKILETVGNIGVPATSIYAIAVLCNLIPVSLPTVLNHLRMLKSPGWEIIEKVGIAFRDNYAITSKGAALLGDAEDAATGFHDYAGEWRERFERMAIVNVEGVLTERASILLEPLRSIVTKHATKNDKQFIVAFMEKQLEPAVTNANKRKVHALKILGF